MQDTVIDFAASDSITLIHMGFARTGSWPAGQVHLFTDKAGDPGAGNLGFRVIHAGAGMGNVDVNLIRHRADTLTLPATPLVANVAYGVASAYVTVAADPAVATPESFQVLVTAAGTTTPIPVNVAVPAGENSGGPKEPIPGPRVAASTKTAVGSPPYDARHTPPT